MAEVQADQPPPTRLEGYDLTLHLTYPGWPQRGLPFEVLDRLNTELRQRHIILPGPWKRQDQFRISTYPQLQDEELDLQTPWITVNGPGIHVLTELAVGFTEAWFELKLGLMVCLDTHLPPYVQITPHGSRWVTEGPGQVSVWPSGDWLDIARTIRNADGFLGDCSALHVLAVAIGVPATIVEPMEGRWNPIFWPLGVMGPQVTLVLGGDGRPTFDARHTRDAVHTMLTREV